MPDSIDVTGFIALFLGVGLLIFTFYNAYIFLKEEFTIVGSPDLIKVFGEVLAPLVKACIQVIYLGVMGWIGSIVTMRGVQILTRPREAKVKEAKPKEAAVAPEAPKPQPATQPS